MDKLSETAKKIKNAKPGMLGFLAKNPDIGTTLGEVAKRNYYSGGKGANAPSEGKPMPEKATPQEETEPVYEAPKRNIITEGLKIVGQGLESYAGGRMREERQDEEDTAKQNYASDLHKYNRARYERLKVKKAAGTLTPAEEKEYIERGGSMVDKEDISNPFRKK